MSRKIKREISSMSYSMDKLYRRISTMKPSTLIISSLAIALAVFLFGGGLYDIIMKPIQQSTTAEPSYSSIRSCRSNS